MFETKAINTLLDNVTNVKTSFIDNYFVAELKQPATMFVEAQRDFGKAVVNTIEQCYASMSKATGQTKTTQSAETSE